MKAKIERITGLKVIASKPLSGGCVGDVYRVQMESGPDLVAKTGGPNTGAKSALELEAYSLLYLAKHSSLPVPDILYSDSELLLMSYLEQGGSLGPGAQKNAGEIVAHLHQISSKEGFGFEKDTVIGGLAQPNPWNSNWVDFFREQRLIYMGNVAMQAGNLPKPMMKRLEKFAGHLEEWIETPKQSSLIHGDMWTGNVLSANGVISGFIDPAIYFADPEIELAFTQMFGTFTQAFFDAYENIRTIKPGFFEERLAIYNLYPLLVHVRLFGGSYVNSVDGTLKKFGY